MVPYVIVFIIVIFLTFLAERYKNEKKGLSSFFALIAIMVVTLFATLRDYSVGTDINIYGLKFFNYASSFTSFKEYFLTLQNEHLYYISNYIIGHIFGNFRVLLFILHFFISYIVFKLAYKSKDNLVNYIAVFMLLIFNSTFNILRQSIAIFIVLYAYHFLKEKKYAKYIIAVLIAQLFHSSAIICLSFIFIDFISKSKHKYLYAIILSLGIVVLMASIDSITSAFNINSFISDKYMRYITSDKSNFNIKLFALKTIMCGFTLFFSFFFNDEKYKELALFPIIDLVLYSSCIWIVYGYRMSYYTLPFYILLVPKISNGIKNRNWKFVYVTVNIILMMVYWYVRYYVYQYDGTMPYIFYWNN